MLSQCYGLWFKKILLVLEERGTQKIIEQSRNDGESNEHFVTREEFPSGTRSSEFSVFFFLYIFEPFKLKKKYLCQLTREKTRRFFFRHVVNMKVHHHWP